MGADFPGSFDGYTLEVQESHQSSKEDTSGTAKAISANLAQLTGAAFTNAQIEKVRLEQLVCMMTPCRTPHSTCACTCHMPHAYAHAMPHAQVRLEDEQLAGGGVSHRGVSPVPKDALPGHAFHTYSLLSGDGQVEFQFRHNVQGRSVYAEGAVDAAVFLAARVAAEEKKRQFTMVDVLRSGAM